ncbi:hypothetical protein BH11PLA2_BH11PLA2_43850 [soil metagenome]
MRLWDAGGGVTARFQTLLLPYFHSLSNEDGPPNRYKEPAMLETIIIILVLLWLLGAFVVPVGGSLIHFLLVIILVVVVIRLLQGRKPLA